MCSFIQSLIQSFLHSITMSRPPAIRPGIMLVLLKLQRANVTGFCSYWTPASMGEGYTRRDIYIFLNDAKSITIETCTKKSGRICWGSKTLTKLAEHGSWRQGAPTAAEALLPQHPLSSSQFTCSHGPCQHVDSFSVPGWPLSPLLRTFPATEGSRHSTVGRAGWFALKGQTHSREWKLMDKPPRLHSLWWVDSGAPLRAFSEHARWGWCPAAFHGKALTTAQITSVSSSSAWHHCILQGLLSEKPKLRHTPRWKNL